MHFHRPAKSLKVMNYCSSVKDVKDAENGWCAAISEQYEISPNNVISWNFAA